MQENEIMINREAEVKINREHKDWLFRLIFGSTLMKLPAPQYVIFYNGSGEHEDEEVLRLSDAFEVKEKQKGTNGQPEC